ncbi:MAG TPA: hypothetical protein PLA33_10870, partial [Ottowia sp.]|nr:hypothetical protein [Ottowia sp.]
RWAVSARNDYAQALVRAGQLVQAGTEFQKIDQDRDQYADNLAMQAELDYARGLYQLALAAPAAAQPLLQSTLAYYRSAGSRGAVATRVAQSLHQCLLALGEHAAAQTLAAEYGLPVDSP